MPRPNITKINQERITSTASSLVLTRDAMASQLKNATTAMDQIQEKFQGKISESKRAEFDKCSLEFNNFCKEIDRYIDFLNKTAAAYTEVDEGSSQSQRPGTFVATDR